MHLSNNIKYISCTIIIYYVHYIVKHRRHNLDQLNIVIAKNLKNLRETRKLSLDNVAKLTGVSKSMIGQIERGEANPTISTLWKIANGFKISFTELMHRPETDIEIVSIKDTRPLIEDGGRFRNYPIFPFDNNRRFEIYTVAVDAGSCLDAEPHPKGTQEFMTLFSGQMTITINNEEYILAANTSIRFKADVAHRYKNTGDETCHFSMVIYYPA